jgi:hypothetical protein
LQHLALRYTQALITQMAQTAVCNRHHALDRQLCRWLLLSLDRLQGNELKMTQELIANMLGVRREGVTEAAGKLQAEGLIRYSRGRIKVLDRSKVEKRVCECYAVVKKEFKRLLPYNIHEPTTQPLPQADDGCDPKSFLRLQRGAGFASHLISSAKSTGRPPTHGVYANVLVARKREWWWPKLLKIADDLSDLSAILFT